MKNAARKKLQRIGWGAAVAAGLLTATGCGYISPQATADEYAPADGIEQTLGDVKVRNLLIVAESENSKGRVLGTVINDGNQDTTLTLDAGGSTARIPVAAHQSVTLEKSKPVILDKAGAMPGLMVSTKLQADGQTSEASVPVLDHTYPRYASFVPGGAPTTPANPSNTPKPAEETPGH